MECPYCNKTYDDDFKFCPYCGEEKPKPKICPKCELEPNVEFSFCPECGEKLINKEEYEEESEKIEIEELKKKELIKKEEELTRLKKESKKIKLKNIVEDEEFVEEKFVEDKELNSTFKSHLISEIDENKIITENELRLEIELIKEEESIKIEQRKLKLKNSLSKMICSDVVRKKLIQKINENKIITEDDLHEMESYYADLKQKRHLYSYD